MTRFAVLKEKTRLNIEIDSNALDELAIGRDILVSVDVRDVSLKSALNLMLEPIGLTYMVEDGYIEITTPDKAAGKLYTRCHDVRGVVDFPLEFDSEEMRSEAETLLDIVTATIAPDTWDEVGGEGSLAAFPRKGVIVCSNTLEVHNEIAAFLNVSRKVRATSRHSAPRDANVVGRDTSVTRIYIFKQTDVKADDIAETIRELIAPDSWVDGAFTKVVQNRLIVRNSRQVHNYIGSLIGDLRLEVENQRINAGGGMMGGGMF